ncbi:MAG: hypothetical protein WDO68_31205 [Gammaproteobacteria bacterium]
MSRRKKWLAGIGIPSRLHLKSHSAGRCVFALSLCLALAACDSGPDVRLLIHASQPVAQDCLEKLPAYLAPQVPVAQIRRPRPQKGVEYEVRGRESRISVFQAFEINSIELALTSQGSGSPERKRENLGLLKSVHSGVLRACNLDPGEISVERSCTGDTCKDPAYPGL